jgi:hypothetical protein
MVVLGCNGLRCVIKIIVSLSLSWASYPHTACLQWTDSEILYKYVHVCAYTYAGWCTQSVCTGLILQYTPTHIHIYKHTCIHMQDGAYYLQTVCIHVTDTRTDICIYTHIFIHIQDGASCLHTACQWGHLEVVKYLCERGGEELLMLTDKVSVTCAKREERERERESMVFISYFNPYEPKMHHH